MHFTLYIIPFVISAVVLAILGTYGWFHRARAAALAFSIAMFCMLFWTVGFIIEIISVELAVKVFWSNVQFIGIAITPVALLIMVIHYLGYQSVKKWFVVMLMIVPVMTIILIITNEFHHLFRGFPSIDINAGPFSVLVNDYGPWYYWILAPYSFFISIASIVLLSYSLSLSKSAYRRQSIILILGISAPLIVNILYVIDITPIPHFNLTTVVFAFSGLVVGYSLFQNRFLDLMPVARNLLVDYLEDAWIVLDDAERIVDMNMAAQKLFEYLSKDLIGKPIESVLGDKKKRYSRILGAEKLQTEIQVQNGDYYDLRIFPLKNRKEQTTGRLILLHNISKRKKMEDEREHLITELKDALERVKTLSGLLPICSHCKKIRDDEGYWQNVETYIAKRSDAVFSHGICPDCLNEFYPQFAKKKLEKEKKQKLKP